MALKPIKKVFNVEYDLTKDEFISQKMEDISNKCQALHGENVICKVTTFTVPDKQIVVSTTQNNQEFLGATNILLAQRPLAQQTFLTMDDDMVKTYEITITANTDLPDYITALDVAQAKADEMFEADDSKLPLVTVIDYRWGNKPTTLTASIFSDIDEEGNPTPLVGATDSAANVTVGDKEAGKNWLKRDMDVTIKMFTDDVTFHRYQVSLLNSKGEAVDFRPYGAYKANGGKEETTEFHNDVLSVSADNKAFNDDMSLLHIFNPKKKFTRDIKVKESYVNIKLSDDAPKVSIIRLNTNVGGDIPNITKFELEFKDEQGNIIKRDTITDISHDKNAKYDYFIA